MSILSRYTVLYCLVQCLLNLVRYTHLGRTIPRLALTGDAFCFQQRDAFIISICLPEVTQGCEHLPALVTPFAAMSDDRLDGFVQLVTVVEQGVFQCSSIGVNGSSELHSIYVELVQCYVALKQMYVCEQLTIPIVPS